MTPLPKRSLLALVVLCSCKGGKLAVDDAENGAPTLQILEPLEDSVFAVEEPFSLVAAADDDDTPIEDLATSLTSDRVDGELVPVVAVVDREGVPTLMFTLPAGLQDEGDHLLALAVRDERGDAAGDEVLVRIVANVAPVVTFLVPEPDAVFGVDDVVTVTASIDDAQEIASLTWGGAAAGLGPPLPEAGLASVELGTLAKGTYVVSLDAEDALGAVGSAQIEITVAQDDWDGDGADADVDCNDDDPDVFPGAEERCNQKDDDCDDVTDEPDAVDAVTWFVDADHDGLGDPDREEPACFLTAGLAPLGDDCDDSDAAVRGATAWYADSDGDGYGDPEITTSACEAPEEHVGNALDCNDGSEGEAYNPGVDEACDEQDNDCDGSVDEGAAIGATWWFRDGDDDGLGDGDGTFACDAPTAHHVQLDGDCNDEDPSATVPLVWYVDDDKDGLGTDEFVASCEAPDKKFSSETGDCDDEDEEVGLPSTWYIDADGDGHGVVTYTDMGCEPAEGFVATDDDCDDLDGDNSPSGTESCDGGDNDCDTLVDEAGATGELTWYADTDGDGFGDPDTSVLACDAPADHVSDDTDCDDDSASDIHPGASELCNTIDDDCDPATDELVWGVDKKTWWEDQDGDGWGDPATEGLDCFPDEVATTAAVYVADDCDDAPDRDDVYPGAPELCDLRDNDCDGGVDEDPTNPTTWTLDRDEDGFGDETPGTATHVSCSVPEGFAGMATDCDDWDPSSYPDAEELCDEVDNDCDGNPDDPWGPPITWFRDQDGDTFGDPDVTTEACAKPSGYVLDATDCHDGETSVNPDGTEVCNNWLDDDCDGSVNQCRLSGNVSAATADVTIYGSTWFGHIVRTGDVTGDGVDDLVVASWKHDNGKGAVRVFAGGDDFAPATENDAGLSWLPSLGGTSTALGYTLGLGDVDDDGVQDVVMGSSAKVYLEYGPLAMSGATGTPGTGARYTGADSYYAGIVGDVNGDGTQEIGVGSIYYTGCSGYQEGRLYVPLAGNNAGTTVSVASDPILGAVQNCGSQWWGSDMVPLGDVTGDGRSEFLVSSFKSRGRVDVVAGGVSGTMTTSTLRLATITDSGNGYNPDQQDWHMAVPAPIGGHTLNDILVGVPTNDEPDSVPTGGRVSVYFSPLLSDVKLTETYATWLGTPDSLAGTGLALGDVSGDGLADVIIGAPREAPSNVGAVHVYASNPFFYPGEYQLSNGAGRLLRVYGAKSNGNLGSSLAVGDLNDDGYGDLVIGAYGNDGSDGGRVYVVFGLGM